MNNVNDEGEGSIREKRWRVCRNYRAVMVPTEISQPGAVKERPRKAQKKKKATALGAGKTCPPGFK